MAAGIVDDIYGANFVSGGTNGDIMDQNGHGTFVAGVVGAVTNNALGVTGINQVQRSSLCSPAACQYAGLGNSKGVNMKMICLIACYGTSNICARSLRRRNTLCCALSDLQSCPVPSSLHHQPPAQPLMPEAWSNATQYSSIVGCRFMDATGNGWVSDAIRCWEYCMTKDTHVLSNSWGGVDYSQALQVDALQLPCST